MGRMNYPLRVDLSRRILAMGCAVLIFALGLFAASPTLHEKLHVGSHDSSSDVCAVALFASGVSVAPGLIALPPVMGEWRDLPCVASQEVFLDSPRYLLQPERGPPVG